MMNHPEWTPVGTPPTSSDMYLIDTERGPRVAAYVAYRRMWLADDCNITESVRAWMPLPASYEPPKPVELKWHDGDEKPPCNGTYYVFCKIGKRETTARLDYVNGWHIAASEYVKVIAWIPIPQVPTEILLRH